MSELRDLTAAMRSFDKRLTSVEACLITITRNSNQEAEWRHNQKNRALINDGVQLENERAMAQVQEACGAISHKLAEVVERLDNLGATRLSDVKELRERTRQLELRMPLPNDEVTKT